MPKERHSQRPWRVSLLSGIAPGVELPHRLLIAVVDDDKSFRESMRRLLKSLGYGVAVFQSAAEFLVSPELATTACLVADVQMPEMTGIELYVHLISTGLAIPTILVTAYPDETVERRALSLGIECYLCKPLGEAELTDCLRCCFARGRTLPAGPA